MSAPVPAQTIVVEPAAVAGLTAELSVLAGERFADASTCRATATAISAALGALEGWQASSATAAWAAVESLLAERTDALAGTMTAAVQAALAEDAALAAHVGRRPR